MNVSDEIRSNFHFTPKYNDLVLTLLCCAITLLIFATIIGNTFVVSAVLFEKRLQAVSNYLILSLAITDLLVAIGVMPLSLINEISVHWYLGNITCDMWTSTDILCCTASILHLVAISLDRYRGVSNIEYIKRRSKENILKMIAVVWVVSFCISIPPLLGWKQEINNPEKYGLCFISRDKIYQTIATVVAFYCPLILMVFLNIKIYKAARYRIRKKHFGSRDKNTSPVECDIKALEWPSVSSDVEEEKIKHLNGRPSEQKPRRTLRLTSFTCCTNGVMVQDCDENAIETTFVKIQAENRTKHTSRAIVLKRQREYTKKCKDRLEMKRERKAVRVLGIITGAFIACWLPFFILALALPFCTTNCGIPAEVMSVTLWLGYFNSLLNPILYTRFNPGFRKAFQNKSKL
ncbi:5-hydroxytryptamine receptor-like [Mya arenaria]|uniref:5-hydroxytryptamine receptor-like n=1 Tax=Mya arenaria TaxID=6604 RepID=UPI0022E75F28|nr:5-hydroxytryptamine receptor-like [Mya arenaria]